MYGNTPHEVVQNSKIWKRTLHNKELYIIHSIDLVKGSTHSTHKSGNGLHTLHTQIWYKGLSTHKSGIKVSPHTTDLMSKLPHERGEVGFCLPESSKSSFVLQRKTKDINTRRPSFHDTPRIYSV